MKIRKIKKGGEHLENLLRISMVQQKRKIFVKNSQNIQKGVADNEF
jgi:hypothetical protein